MAGNLPKTVSKKKKRVGRGYGSGKGGHTVGRGSKGQKARSKPGLLFEGVKMKKSFIKRLPLARGKGKFKPQDKPIIVKLAYLNLLPTGSKVDIGMLVKHGIVRDADAQKYGVKILGDGDLKKKLKVYLPISKSAAKKITKAGGEVIKENEKKVKKPKKVLKKDKKKGSK